MARSIVLLLVLCVVVLCSAAEVVAGSVRGRIVGDRRPYVVRGADGSIFTCEWYGGSTFWIKGDEVLLTKDSGFAQMVNIGGVDRTAKVWVEQGK